MSPSSLSAALPPGLSAGSTSTIPGYDPDPTPDPAMGPSTLVPPEISAERKSVGDDWVALQTDGVQGRTDATMAHQLASTLTKNRKRSSRKRRKRKRTNSAISHEQLHAIAAPARRLDGPYRLSYASHCTANGVHVRVPLHTYRVTRRITPPRTQRTVPYGQSEMCTAVLVPPGTPETEKNRTRDPTTYAQTYVPQVFNRDEYVRLNHEYGLVSLDLYASPYSAVVPQYFTDTDKLLQTPLHGHTLWADLTTCDRTHEILNYIESVRKDFPCDVRAIILVPQWGDSTYKQFRNILKKYRKIHTYPAGTYLHSAYCTQSDTLKPLPPTKYPIEVYLADHTVEERETSSVNQAQHTQHLKLIGEIPRKSTLPAYQPKQYKSHQPRFGIPLCSVSSQSEENDLIILNAKYANDGTVIKSLLGCGATRDFISRGFIQRHNLIPEPLSQNLRVSLADGRQVVARTGVTLSFNLDSQSFTRQFVITELHQDFDIILGMPFLRDVNPKVQWDTGTVTLPDSSLSFSGTVRPRHLDIDMIHANAMARIIKKSRQYPTTPGSGTSFFLATLRQVTEPTNARLNSIPLDGQSPKVADQIKSVQTDQSDSYTLRVQQLLNKHNTILAPLEGLPPPRPGFDHEIHLAPEARVPPGKVYRMSTMELEELKTQLKNYVSKDWISVSTSMYAAPVLFARKANGSLRMCVDYRKLNQYTKRVEFPLPNIDTILDTLGGSKYFTALDLAQGYHQVQVRPQDRHLTAFKTQYGLFEFNVLPFGLTSAPSTFQRLMNHVLKPHEKDYVICYLDDVLIHSSTLEDHLNHLDEVLGLLAENSLKLRLEKCDFAMSQLDYLGHTISAKGIQPSDKKIQAVKDWPIPTSVRDVQSFLGFCNFYRRYMKHYSVTANPLYNLTRKNVPFNWDASCQTAFHQLKLSLTTAPVLMTPRTGPEAEFVLSTDASNTGIGAVLLQMDPTSNTLRPISYYAKSLNTAQRNYPVYDLELLAMASAASEYRHYLEGCKKISFITDHATLQYLPTQASLSRRHTGFVMTLSPYFAYTEIIYRKGSENDSDLLSRRPDFQQIREVPLDSNPDLKALLSSYDAGQFEADIATFHEFISGLYHLQMDESLLNDIKQGYTRDNTYSGRTLPVGVLYNENTGLYYKADKVCVPTADQGLLFKIISEFHDASGHPDQNRTTSNLMKIFWWKGKVHNTVKEYIKKCKTCQRVKASTLTRQAPLKPMPTPTRPWENMSMDFITHLPLVDGYDSIVTFVDMFTKQAHFIPCTSNIGAP